MGFEFVLVNDKSFHDKVKKHLRDRQSEQRRRKLKASREANVALKASSIVSHGPLKWRHKWDDLDCQSASSSSLSSGSRRVSTSSSDDAQDEPQGVESSSAVYAPPSSFNYPPFFPTTTHPATLLSTTRRDPFRCYPVSWYPELDALVDFYLNLGPYCFDYPSNPEHDLFRRHAQLSMSDPAAFHGMLLLAAITQDKVKGQALPGLRSVCHRVEAIKEINQRLGSPDPAVALSASTIYAVSRLHILEKQWNAVGSNEVYSTGLGTIVTMWGGLKRLAMENPDVETMVYLSALVTPSMLRPGSPSLYDPSCAAWTPSQETHAMAAEFSTFLEHVIDRSLYATDLSARFAFVLGPGTAMHRLLTTCPQTDPRYPAFTQQKMVDVGHRLRRAITLYIHCVLLLATTEVDIQKFVQHLRWISRQEWIWGQSVRMLQYLLVQNEHSANLTDSVTAWKVLRLGNAAELLAPKTAEKIQRSLIGMLSGEIWEPIDVRMVKEELAANAPA